MTKRNPDPDPICEREELAYRVTNLPDTEKWSNDIPHRSARVCSVRACVLDAMAWVERGTGQKALVYDTNGNEVKNL